MNNLAIIPARGGSKRIPRKNIKPFLGKPIIAYSIEAALKSGLFSEVMVSTDDDEIAEIAIKYGAKVPFIRTSENANDYATLADVINEVQDVYQARGKTFDNICCILPTAPLIQLADIEKAYKLMHAEAFDSVRPVVEFDYPIQRAQRLDGNKVSFMHPENYTKRSQDLEPAYHDSGMFYWFKGDKNITSPNKGAIIIPSTAAQDIDNEEEWQLAEMKYNLLMEKQS